MEDGMVFVGEVRRVPGMQMSHAIDLVKPYQILIMGTTCAESGLAQSHPSLLSYGESTCCETC